VLGPQRGDIGGTWNSADRAEAIAALRQAAEHRTDPQRDLTLYNLAQLLGGGTSKEDEEADRIREDLMRTSRYYRATWYLRREVGAAHYHRASAAAADGHDEQARREYRRAARWYSRALRARPHLRFFEFHGPQVRLFHRYRQSATLLANAWDAHRKAGHRLRAWWYGKRTRREQRYQEQLGLKRFAVGHWEAAEAHFDWAIVGYRDRFEIVSWVHKAVSLRQMGHDQQAEETWAEAIAHDPFALFVRAILAQPGEAPPLPRGLPGSETTDLDTVVGLLKQKGVLVPRQDADDGSVST
jgi:tetratricopeptide (TPR) repeat protein